MDKEKRKEIRSTLGRHGRILAAVNRAAEQLVLSSKWLGFVEDMISEIGEVMNASCIRVVKNHIDQDGDIVASQKYQWVNKGLSPAKDDPVLENLSYRDMGFGSWLRKFEVGEIFSGSVAEMSGPGAEWLTAGKVKYITCTPILVDRQCWGVIGFENWHDAFPLPDADILALETAARLIGAAIHRDRIEKDLSNKQAQLIYAGRITAMGEMASGIAHEMNQPLTVINLSADVCTAYFKKNAPGVPEAEAADDIREQVKRIAQLVQNMRSFSRRSSGKMSRINLADPLQVALTFFRQQFRSHRINLVEEVAAKLPLVSTNQQRIEQIAVNLLSNARYAVEKRMEGEKGYRGEIKVRLSMETFSNDKNEFLKMSQAHSHPQQGIVFEVIDNGTGMDDEVRKRCLEPFYTTSEVGEGAGLGLSVTYGLIKALGFSLEIESKKNIGSTFRVIVPIQKEERFAQE